MSEYDDERDVDPANGTVEHFVEPPAAAGPPGIEADAGGSTERFTAPEKIAAVAQAITSRPSADPKVAALLSVVTSRLGRSLVLNPALALLPPMDEPDAWDDWLALLVGCALELTSDDVIIDVPAAQRNARSLIVSLFEGEG